LSNVLIFDFIKVKPLFIIGNSKKPIS